MGVLFAPKSGKETREEISEESEKLISQFKSDIENAKKAALRSFDQGKEHIIERLVPDDSPAETASPEEEESGRPKRKRPPRNKSKKEKES